jgi:hypothetical protein
MDNKLFKRAKKILPLIGIFIFVYIVYSLDFDKIRNAFLLVKPVFIFLSLFLTIPRLLVRNYAWQLIQKEQKIQLRFFTSLKIFLIGYFYGSITPGFIGQLMRVPYIKEKTGQPYGKLFVNTLIESIVHTLSLYGMMVIGAFLILEAIPELLPITISWVVVLAIILLFFIKKERGERIFFTLVRYLIPKNVKNKLNRFITTFYTDFPNIHKLLLPFILGIVTWIIIFTQEYIIIVALGLNIPYLYFLLLFPIANTAGFIPVTFAGLGTRELTSILIFSTLYAVTKEEVFVFTIVGFILTDIFTGFIGFLLSITETKFKKSIPTQ